MFKPGYFTKARNAPSGLVAAEHDAEERFDSAYRELSRHDAIPAACIRTSWLEASLFYPGVLVVKVLKSPASKRVMMESLASCLLLGGCVGTFSLILDLTNPPPDLNAHIMKDIVPYIRERRMWSRMQLQSMSFVLSSRNAAFAALATSVLKTVFHYMHRPSAPLSIICGRAPFPASGSGDYDAADRRAIDAAKSVALSSPLNGYRVPFLSFDRRDPGEVGDGQAAIAASAASSLDQGDLSFGLTRLICTAVIAYLGTKLFVVPSEE